MADCTPMRGSHHEWQGWLTLVSFVLALLAGIFLHPVQEHEFHRCDVPGGHVERDPGHDDHAPHACALCHLAQTVASATCPSVGPAFVAPLTPARVDSPPASRPLASASPRRLTCRGPPLV